MKLIDSSVWIRLLRQRARAVQTPVSLFIRQREAAINGMILVELLRGARDDAVFAGIRDELEGVVNLPTITRTWDIAADLGYRLRRSGFPMAVPDLVVAASAIEHDIVLLHADSDFDRIAQHSDLKVESYVGT